MDSLLLNCIPVQDVPLFLTNSNVLLTVSTLKHVISLLKRESQTLALSKSNISLWVLVSNSSRNGRCYHPIAEISSPYFSLHAGSTESKQIYSKWISALHSNKFVPSLLQMPTQRLLLVLVALTFYCALMEYGFGRQEKSIISATGKVEMTRPTEFQNYSFSLLTCVCSQALLCHKDRDSCCWWLPGKRREAGKSFLSFYSDLCYHHHWPAGGESQGGRKARLFFYSYALFSWFNYSCFHQSLETYKSYF